MAKSFVLEPPKDDDYMIWLWMESGLIAAVDLRALKEETDDEPR